MEISEGSRDVVKHILARGADRNTQQEAGAVVGPCAETQDGRGSPAIRMLKGDVGGMEESWKLL